MSRVPDKNPVAQIIERLLEPDTVFASVAGAADLAAIEDSAIARPAAFVLSVEEVTGPNERFGEGAKVLQRHEADIAVVIVMENLSDVAMGEARADIETCKRFVRTRLLGFVPDGADEPMTHVSGTILKARQASVWFEDKYTLTTCLEQTS